MKKWAGRIAYTLLIVLTLALVGGFTDEQNGIALAPSAFVPSSFNYQLQISNYNPCRSPRRTPCTPSSFPLIGAPLARLPIPGNTTVTLPLSFPCLHLSTSPMLELAGDAPRKPGVRLNFHVHVRSYDLVNRRDHDEKHADSAKRNGINILTSNSFVCSFLAKSPCVSR